MAIKIPRSILAKRANPALISSSPFSASAISEILSKRKYQRGKLLSFFCEFFRADFVFQTWPRRVKIPTSSLPPTFALLLQFKIRFCFDRNFTPCYFHQGCPFPSSSTLTSKRILLPWKWAFFSTISLSEEKNVARSMFELRGCLKLEKEKKSNIFRQIFFSQIIKFNNMR